MKSLNRSQTKHITGTINPSPSSWLTRTLIPATLAFAAGIGIIRLIALPAFLCIFLTLLIGTRLLLAERFGKSRLTPLLVIPLFFFVGHFFALSQGATPQDSNHLTHLIGGQDEYVLYGRLVNSPAVYSDRTVILVESQALQLPDARKPASGLARLVLYDRLPENINPGDKFLVRCVLSQPSDYNVPGVFSYRNYLAQKSIYITGYVKSAELIQKVHPLEDDFSSLLPFFAERMRYRIITFLNNTLSSEVNGLYKALITGDRSGLDKDTMEQFKATGTMHLIAISGLHMGIVLLSTTFLIITVFKSSTRLLLRVHAAKWAMLIALIPLIFYAGIAGFQPPVVRALLMSTVVAFAFILNQPVHAANCIAFAALLMLSANPLDLFTPSFQLSFAAVSAIAALFPILQQKYRHLFEADGASGNVKSLARLRRQIIFWFGACFLLSIAAFIGTAPIVVFHFNRISLLGPLATLIIEPILCFWSLLFGLLGSALLPLSENLALLLFKAGAPGIMLTKWLVQQMSTLPGNSLWLPPPLFTELAGYYLLLAALICWIKNNRRPAAVLFIGGLLMMFLPQSKTAYDQQTEIGVLDVGQGQAIFIQSPSGKNYLLDGGSRMNSPNSSFDVGERVIAPFLWQRQIRRLDGIIISHPHADHYAGLQFVIDKFKPPTIWITSQPGGESKYQDLLNTATELGSTLHPVRSSIIALEDKYFTMKILPTGLGEPPDFSDLSPKEKYATMNDASLVVQIFSGRHRFLFPSDLEEYGEQHLLSTSQDLKTDVLIAPHHGSATSSSDAFVDATAPKYLVVSSGKQEFGTFPAPTVLDKYRAKGAVLLMTPVDGTVFFRSDGQEMTVSGYRHQ